MRALWRTRRSFAARGHCNRFGWRSLGFRKMGEPGAFSSGGWHLKKSGQSFESPATPLTNYCCCCSETKKKEKGKQGRHAVLHVNRVLYLSSSSPQCNTAYTSQVDNQSFACSGIRFYGIPSSASWPTAETRQKWSSKTRLARQQHLHKRSPNLRHVAAINQIPRN